MPHQVTMVQIKTFFLCLLLSFSSTQVLLSQIPSCCRPGSENFQPQSVNMSCHGVPEAALTQEDGDESEADSAQAEFKAAAEQRSKDKKWSNKSTICHCKPYILSLLGIKPYYADAIALNVPPPESYEVAPHAVTFDSPTDVFMTITTKPPILA